VTQILRKKQQYSAKIFSKIAIDSNNIHTTYIY